MPLFDLQCTNKSCKRSKEVVEVFASFSELEEIKCSECKSSTKQIVQGASIHIAAHHRADYKAGS